MDKIQILQMLTQLPPVERLSVIEAAIHQLRQDMARESCAQLSAAMEAAAHALLEDYLQDPELTVFTCLDSEDWDETR
jgi:hypothetical protein